MKIEYKKLTSVSGLNQYQFDGLKINDIDIGYFLADCSTDLGQALLKYIKENNLSVNSESINSNESNLLSELIKDLIQKTFTFINNMAKSKGFLSTSDCISYLNSDVKAFALYAKNFKQWRDNVLNLLQIYIAEVTQKEKEVSFNDLQTTLPELQWSKGILDEQDFITNLPVEKDALSIEELKGRKYLQIKKEYQELTSFINPKVYFQSSIILEDSKLGLYFNGDFRSKNYLESLLSLNKDKYEIRTYENKIAILTHKQLKQVLKELNENLEILYLQKIKKDTLVKQATYKEDLDVIDMSYQMIIR